MVTGLFYFPSMLFSQTGVSGARGNVSNVKASDQIRVRAHESNNKALAPRISENCIFTQLILRAEHAAFRWQMGRQKGNPTEKQTKVLPPYTGCACWDGEINQKNAHKQYKMCFHL